MRRFSAIVAGCLLLLASGCLAHLRTPSPADRDHLVEVNRHLFERMLLHHDTAPYSEVALPEYLFVANIGIVETLDEVVSTPQNLNIQKVTITNEEMRTRGNTAILIGLMEIQGTVLGFPLPEQMRYLSVFTHTGGRWRLMAQSLTAVNDPRVAPGSR